MSAERWALGLWIALAIVVFNVTFDRQLFLAAVAHTRASVERYHRGEALVPLRASYQAEVTRAAWWSTGAGGVVLLVGFVLIRQCRNR